MLFLSQVIGKPVRDRDGGTFGKVRDLIVALGEQYPPVTGLVIRVTGGREIFLPWSDVEDFDISGARLHTSSIDITTFRQRPNEIRLFLDLLDKQIVDVEGRKIVRVNDIQLAPVRERLRLVAVDVGLAGILRRLGLSGPGERLAQALHMPIENYIEWEEVDPVESSVSSLKLRVPHQALATLLWEGRFSLTTAVLAGFGRASAEVGAVMIVGGNIEHATRTMTTAIALETSKGNLSLALGLGLLLMLLSLVINGAAYLIRDLAGRRQ